MNGCCSCYPVNILAGNHSTGTVLVSLHEEKLWLTSNKPLMIGEVCNLDYTTSKKPVPTVYSVKVVKLTEKKHTGHYKYSVEVV